MTGYFKLNEYVEESSTYSRSIWHNRTHNGCGGSDYKLKSTMNRCGGEPDRLITWGSPVATFRWDDTANVQFRNLSVRETQGSIVGCLNLIRS
jgi:hypothetical protein